MLNDPMVAQRIREAMARRQAPTRPTLPSQASPTAFSAVARVPMQQGYPALPIQASQTAFNSVAGIRPQIPQQFSMLQNQVPLGAAGMGPFASGMAQGYQPRPELGAALQAAIRQRLGLL